MEDGGDGGEAERAARRARMRRAVRDRMLSLGLSQKELGERAGLSKSGVGRLLSGERDPRMETLERLAAALGVPVARLVDPPVDSASTRAALTAPGLSGGEGASLQSPERSGGDGQAEAGGGGVRVSAAVYPAFALWGRVDPRAAVAPSAGGDKRRVMRELGSGLGGPEDVFAVLVGDETLAEIETSAGRVRTGWRLFVDRRTAAMARPGAVVAGMSATGRLVVGALERHADDAWSVFTGTHREGLAGRGDVLGEVVEYQPPPAAIGHIRGGGPANPEGAFFVAAGEPPAAKAG